VGRGGGGVEEEEGYRVGGASAGVRANCCVEGSQGLAGGGDGARGGGAGVEGGAEAVELSLEPGRGGGRGGEQEGEGSEAEEEEEEEEEEDGGWGRRRTALEGVGARETAERRVTEHCIVTQPATRHLNSLLWRQRRHIYIDCEGGKGV
jgi:hypothetical protein